MSINSATKLRKSPVFAKDFASNISLTKARKPSVIKAEEEKQDDESVDFEELDLSEGDLI